MTRSLLSGSCAPLAAVRPGRSVALPGFVLLLLAVWLLSSCAPRISREAATLPPIIRADSTSQKFNMQLDFRKHHFSGMLIVRRLPDEEIRLLATTYFGLSLFDFSLHRGAFRVNSCIAPMQQEKVLKLLESDFRLLFLSTTNARIREQSPAFEQRISGRGFGKSVLSLSEYTDAHPQQIQIRHPWIKLTIQLNKLQP